ncbi:MAG: Fpg/Nei family DNA glycosylase [Acidimicrobiales bacterium]|nr:Fpg/Nei family DNA glycosylase [Acidimicrobiales bacterium]
MPEGDTLHRSASRLRPALEGRRLTRFEAPRLTGTVRPTRGSTIVSVEAVGKHLLIAFDDGVVLRTHLRMSGSWHLYRVGERWRKGAHLARAVVGTDEWEAVCFSAPVVEAFRARPGGDPRPADHPLAHLGPDLCRPDVDLDAAVERMAAVVEPDEEIKVVLLDQRVAAGIGNVYASEVCWACGVDPFTPVAAVDPAMRRRLLVTASTLLRANLGSGPRTTVPGGPGSLAVYGRRGQSCRRCGTPVRMTRQGEQARSTYWCPTCQPASPARRTSPVAREGGEATRSGDG